jgi:PhnB protein
MKSISVYLNFDGNCRQAMEFYKKCLGGELYTMPFSQAPLDSPKEAKDRLIHAALHAGSATLMASDTMPGMPFKQGNNFAAMIECEDAAEQDRIFAALGEGGTVTMPLQDTFWDARFGMVTDQFGIGWMFNLPKAKN